MKKNEIRRKIGYARVSTTGQTLDMQMKTLKKTGCEKIFCEKISGAKAQRAQLRKMINCIKKGDTVVVTRIDRLARSTFDLFSIVQNITQKGACFYSLSEPWADTNTSTGRLMLAVLAGLADVERDLIKIRTAEGRARAIAQGKRMGRPSKMTAVEKQEIITRRLGGEPLKSVANAFGISLTTVSRFARQSSLDNMKKRTSPHL
ncbi:recombinase family protein [Acetobacter farinalis]|uniref:Recombinase family protein n=1 Tax=Acetobacter farinalis TaxID=1260984 RepID=A0ABT3Q648_9PROT|nr:recombinase family protein [Acetobacter farinalis]MCX2560729.1 recombinase family protein [Acetobacter farinalis]NHO29131.1 recombinase family protein [Acetobacter farinalis]